MRLTDLDVVNDCLATLGEAPLNSINNTDHPLVSGAVRLLREANARVQAHGWWFNRETVTIQPDSVTKHIPLPADFLTVDPTDRSMRYTERGRSLYDLAGGTVVFENPVELDFIRLIPFKDLPWNAQDLIRAATLVRFVESYDADEARIQQVRVDYQVAWSECNAEHARFIKSNFLSQGGVGRRRANIRVTMGRPTRGLGRR